MTDEPRYDAEADGARCDECILQKYRTGGPIQAELKRTSVIVVTDTPRETDVDEGRPLVDAAGIEFTESLKAVGIPRNAVSVTTALACRPPDNEMDMVLKKLQKENRKREQAKEPLLPHPIDCCKPRLLKEVGRHQQIITLGKTALNAVTGISGSIIELRGGPVEGDFDMMGNFREAVGGRVKVLPTIHPAFVMRARRWTRAFRSDLSRAFRWFQSGALGWVEPTINLKPSVDEVEEFLSRGDHFVYDVETTIDDPLVAKLKCVGIANEYASIVVTFKSIEGPNGTLVDPPWYMTEELDALRGILRDFFIDETKMKVGHNAGYFDRLVIEQHFGVTPTPLLDTILLHRSVESELPHRLGYVGSVYTDVTTWKAAHTATNAQTDQELSHYCAIDCVVTARVMPKLVEAVQFRKQGSIVAYDHRIQSVCAGMHRTGMNVDRALREVKAAELGVLIHEYLGKTREAAGKPLLNPNSPDQVRALLFDEWQLTPTALTKAQEPSTSDEALRLARTENRDREQVTSFIDNLRRYRKYAKEYGTYVRRLIPYNAPLDGLKFKDEDEEEQAERGLILADGRMHPDYNAHGTTSGRLSSSNPNAQNFPKGLRALVLAPEGRVLVGADADQLELRIIASIAQIPRYLDTLAKGGDPHADTASMMFGKAFDDLVPKSDQWSKLRGISKGIAYASFYGSGDETVHGLVTSAETPAGVLMYPDLTLAQVSALRRRWLKNIPQLQKWWDDCLDTYRTLGYMTDPVWGRRRDFLDGEKFNEIINFGVQSGGAHIIHESTFELVDAIPFEKWGEGTGLINQCHDALVFEVPKDHDEYRPTDADGNVKEKEREFGWCPVGCKCEANRVAKMIKESMNRSVPGLPDVSFAAKPKIGLRWSEV